MSEQYTLKYTGNEVDGLLDNANSLSGIIVMWSGAIDKIPTGWLLCDGTNGTPDLRNRFIVGAGTDYSVGNTGGTNNVVLTTAQMPSHTHSGSINLAEGGAHTHTLEYGGSSSYTKYPYSLCSSENLYHSNYYDTDGAIITGGGSAEGAHSHTGTATINSTGGGAAHENRPPYYALAYIMKI